MVQLRLRGLAYVRSGDKGNTCDIGLFARTPEMYEIFVREVTANRVKEHFSPLVQGSVTRFEVPNVLGLKFVLEEALGGGAASSLRSDNLGKSFGSILLRLVIEIPEELCTEDHLVPRYPR